MACEIAVTGRVVLVLWGKPQATDLPLVERAVERARAASGPVIFIARVPEHAAPPDPHLRDAISAMLDHFLTLCASYHTVLEGSGFAAAAKRMVVSAIFVVTGRRGRTFVHSHCEDVPSVLKPHERAEVEAALQVMRARGLLDRPEPRVFQQHEGFPGRAH